MADKKIIEFYLKETDSILDIAKLGEYAIQEFSEKLNTVRGSKDFSLSLSRLLNSSYEDLRTVAKNICERARNFDNEDFFKLFKEDVSSKFKTNIQSLLNKCSYIESEDDVKEFSDKLAELSKVFTDENRKNSVLEEIKSIADHSVDIIETARDLFSEVKSELGKISSEKGTI